MSLNFNMRRYIQDHLSLYVFVSVLFLMGVVFGAMLVNSLSLEQQQELSRFFGSYLHTMEQGYDGQSSSFFSQSFISYTKWIVLIGLFGLTVIGIPLVLVLDFLKGVLIGFTVGYMVGEMGWNGMLFSLLSIVPQNMIVIPLVIVASVSALSLSITLVRHRFQRHPIKLPEIFAAYAAKMFALILVSLAVSLYEAYVTPVLIQWMAPRMLSTAVFLYNLEWF